MKATGITRKLDSLGRIVIPKEIRRVNHLGEGAALEIYTDQEGGIILKKYSPMVEIGDFAKQYADTLSQSTGYTVCISDRDTVIAASGSLKKDFFNKPISPQLDELISRRESVGPGQSKQLIPILPGDSIYGAQAIYPIIAEGDAIGSVSILSRDSRVKFTDAEFKAASIAASFIGRHMES